MGFRWAFYVVCHLECRVLILEYSQGAAFAAIIAAVLEKPETYPPFLVDGKPPHPPMRVFFLPSPAILADLFFLGNFASQSLVSN
jgi:hypothetical protein